MQHLEEALNSSTQLDPLCCSKSSTQMVAISGAQAPWPPQAKRRNMCARLLWQCNYYYSKAEVRRVSGAGRVLPVRKDV